MDKLKKWVALTVVGCLVILAAGWFLLVSPKRSEASELQAQAATQVANNAQLETELQMLKAKAQDLPKEQAKLAEVAAKLPDNPALPGLVRSLLEASTRSGAQLVSVAPGPPALVAPAAPVAPEAPAAAQTTGGTEAPAAPAAPAPGAAGELANIPLAITVAGDYFEVQQFVAALEELPRALRVTTLNLAPGVAPTAKDTTNADSRNLLTTISGFVYMAANRPSGAAAVPAVPAAPVGGAAPTTVTPAS